MTGSLRPGGLTHPQALLSLSVISRGSLWASQWPGGPQFGFDGACPLTVVAASQELLSQSSLLRQTVEVAVVFLLPPQSCPRPVEETHLTQEKGSLF